METISLSTSSANVSAVVKRFLVPERRDSLASSRYFASRRSHLSTSTESLPTTTTTDETPAITVSDEKTAFTFLKRTIEEVVAVNTMVKKHYQNNDIMCEIIPGKLYLGSNNAAMDGNLLKSFQITHILTVSKDFLPLEDKEFVNLQLDHTNTIEDDYLSFFDLGVQFIEQAINQKRAVLVHCNSGVTRSPVFVAAYLMKTRDFDIEEAINTIKKERPALKLSLLQTRQLKLYKRLNFFVSNNAELLLWKLECVCREHPSIALVSHGFDPEILFRRDIVSKVINKPTSDFYQWHWNIMKISVVPTYKCVSCNKLLITSLNVELEKRNSYLVEKMNWMKINSVTGPIKCPKCKDEIGWYDMKHSEAFAGDLRFQYKLQKDRVSSQLIKISELVEKKENN